MNFERTSLVLRVAARFQRADQATGMRKEVRDMVSPINAPKGMSRSVVKDYVTTEEAERSNRPSGKDITPKDVFQPKPNNMNVLDYAYKGWPGTADDYQGMEKAIQKQIPKDKGYDTVSNLSQYLVETAGGGGTKAVGK